MKHFRWVPQDLKMIGTIGWNPLGFHLLDALPKGNTLNTEYCHVKDFTELLPLRMHVDRERLVIHVDNANPTPSQRAKRFPKKICSASPYTHRTHLILYRPSFFFSGISNIVCMESLFHHMKRYLQQFMKSSGPSRDQPWRACFGTGPRDSNGLLRIMVTIIHKLNTG
jgi:hypothetical protein